MKYIVDKITDGEEELILRYKELNTETEAILAFMEKRKQKLFGRTKEGNVVFSVDELLYVEKVDEKTFAYTRDDVIQLEHSLSALEVMLGDERFFRCSKSMIVNIDKVERLKSLPSNRIDALMCSGEHIIISRTYASEFRRILKGDR